MNAQKRDAIGSRLREAQLQAEQPCLPYLGLFLSDLTFIECVHMRGQEE